MGGCSKQEKQGHQELQDVLCWPDGIPMDENLVLSQIKEAMIQKQNSQQQQVTVTAATTKQKASMSLPPPLPTRSQDSTPMCPRRSTE